MRLSDHAAHFEHFRMSPAQFDELLNIVGPAITKKASTFREPIQPAMKLAITIRYLVDGPSMKTLSKNYRVGLSTVCNILNEVPKAIWDLISRLSVKVPATEGEWKKIAKDFWYFK